MAFEDQNQNLDDELLNNGQPTSGPVGGGVLGGGASAPATSGSGQSGANGFTNVGQFLAANQNQGSSLANQVVGDIENSRQGFLADVNQSQTDFQNSVLNNNSLDTGVADLAAQDPTQLNAGQVANFQRLFNGNFQGNTSLDDGGGVLPLQNQFNALQNRAGLTSSESGRNQLLNEFSPNSTAGETALDQLLIQNNPQARQIFEDLRTNVNTAGSAIDEAIAGSQDFVSNRQQDLRNISEELNNRFIGDFVDVPLTRPDTNLGPIFKLASTPSNAPGFSPAGSVLQQLQNDVLTRNQDINSASRSFLSPFFEGTETANPFKDFTAEQTTSSAQFDRLNALENLLGRDFNFLGDSETVSRNDIFNTVADIARNAPDRPRIRVSNPRDVRGFHFQDVGPERPHISNFSRILDELGIR